MQVIMMEIAACLEMKISSADYTFGGWSCKRDKRISELAMLFELASLCTQSTEQIIQTTYVFANLEGHYSKELFYRVLRHT